MKIKRGGRPEGRGSATVVLTTVAILSLVLVGGTYLRMQTARERTTERNLRELERIGRAVEGQVDNLASVLSGIATQALDDQAGPDGVDSVAKEKAALVQGLGDIHVERSTVFEASPGEADSAAGTPRAGRDLHVDELDERHTYLQLVPGDALLIRHQERGPQRTFAASARWSLDALRSLMASEYFASVVLATADGTVFLSQSSNAGLRVQNLSGLRAEGDTAAAPNMPPPSASEVVDVEIAGRSYVAFRQPIRLRLLEWPPQDSANARGATGTDWILAGLVPSDELRRESMALGPVMMLTLSGLVILGMLLAPFVSVGLMGPRERLHVRQLFYLIVSLIVGGGLSGLMLADFSHYHRLRDSVYSDLERVADQLEANFISEVRAAYLEAGRLDSIFRAVPDTTQPWAFQNRIYSDTTRDWTTLDSTTYDRFQTMAWADADGRQVAKWTPRALNTPAVSVAGRAYFRVLRSGGGWSLPPSRTGTTDSIGEERFYLESIRSLTTGENLGVISRPSGDGMVAAMSTPLASVQSTVLPAGVQFAVVDSVGATQFHLRPERVLAEDFIGETGEDPLVESLLAARAVRSVDASYRQRRSRMAFRPIHGTPLTLVLVLDKAALETARFDAWFVGALTFSVYAFMVLVWFLVVELGLRSRVHWIWPDLKQPAKHFWAGVMFGGFALALGVEAYRDASGAPHFSGAFLPFVAMGAGLVILSLPARPFRSLFDSVAERRDDTDLGRAFLTWQAWVEKRALRLLSWRPRGEPWFALKARALGLVLTTLALGGMVLAYWSELDVVLLGVQLIALGVAGRIVWKMVERTGTFRPGPVRVRYNVSLALGLLVVAIAPGYLSYQTHFADHMELVMRHNQVQVTEKLAQREGLFARDSVRAATDSVPMARWVRCSGADIAFQGMFTSLAALDGADAVCHGGYDLDLDAEPMAGEDVCAGGDEDHRDWHHRLHEIFGDRAPWLTRVSVEMRQLGSDSEGRCWARDDAPLQQPTDLEAAAATDGSAPAWLAPRHAGPALWFDDGRFAMASLVPRGVGIPTGWWFVFLLTAFAASIGVFHWLAVRVFLIGMGDPARVLLPDALRGELGRHVALICLRSTDRSFVRRREEAGELAYVDLIEIEEDEGGRPQLPTPEHRVVCIDHFDHRLLDRVWSESLVGYLEKLMYVRSRIVILLTSREPDEIFPPAAEVDQEWGILRERWLRLLGHFAKVAVADDAAAVDLRQWLLHSLPDRHARRGWPEDYISRVRHANLDEILVEECGSASRLHHVARQVALSPAYMDADPEELYEMILEGATPFYSALWAVLGQEERLVVAQLAAGAVVNPQCVRSVRRLFARGIIVRGPELKLFNRTFGAFVRETVPASTVREWERSGAPSTWSQIRVPLMLIWIAMGVFLFWTQRSLLGEATAFLGTAGVGLAAILRMMTLFEKGPTSPDGDG